MKTRATILAILLFGTALSANANQVQLGEIDLTGTFTLNHLYDFNHPGAQPFGSFGAMTAGNVTGIFVNLAHGGDALGFSNGPALWTVGTLPVWTLGGLNISTLMVLITGADSGRNVFGAVNIDGQGFNPPPGYSAHWSFTAPPYDIGNFHHDITGPIDLTLSLWWDNGVVPDAASTLLLLGLATTILVYTRKVLARH